MYLSTKEVPPKNIKNELDKQLDIPTGAIKDDTPFSQRIFLIGTGSHKPKVSNSLSSHNDPTSSKKSRRSISKPINSEVLKNALMT